MFSCSTAQVLLGLCDDTVNVFSRTGWVLQYHVSSSKGSGPLIPLPCITYMCIYIYIDVDVNIIKEQ